MREAVFLSASVPDPERAPDYAETADSVAITSAISGLLFVTLGRRPLVWGGHPAITPMVWAAAEAFDVDYGAWVRLYQSLRWEDEFPEDNQRFQNVTFTPDVNGDREASLSLMRTRMFTEHEFSAAVFVGGMAGILDEYHMFRELQPTARLVPVTSTGGASGTLPPLVDDLERELDYIEFFHAMLNVSPREERYRTPTDQPPAVDARLR